MTYYILGIKKDTQGVITHLRIASYSGSSLDTPTTKTEAEVVQLIDKGHTVSTAVWNYTKSGWLKGATVGIVRGTQRRFLRSHKDGTVNDNLDHLLRIEWF